MLGFLSPTNSPIYTVLQVVLYHIRMVPVATLLLSGPHTYHDHVGCRWAGIAFFGLSDKSIPVGELVVGFWAPCTIKGIGQAHSSKHVAWVLVK